VQNLGFKLKKNTEDSVGGWTAPTRLWVRQCMWTIELCRHFVLCFSLLFAVPFLCSLVLLTALTVFIVLYPPEFISRLVKVRIMLLEHVSKIF